MTMAPVPKAEPPKADFTFKISLPRGVTAATRETRIEQDRGEGTTTVISSNENQDPDKTTKAIMPKVISDLPDAFNIDFNIDGKVAGRINMKELREQAGNLQLIFGKEIGTFEAEALLPDYITAIADNPGLTFKDFTAARIQEIIKNIDKDQGEAKSVQPPAQFAAAKAPSGPVRG